MPKSRVFSDPAMYGICRILHAKTNTWSWRVSIFRNGKKHSRNFADRKYGGTDPALKQAQVCRDQLLEELGPPMNIREFAMIRRSNNKSGIPGVSICQKQGQQYWEARVQEPSGRFRCRLFSIDRLGNEEALAKAISAREELLQYLSSGYMGTPDRDWHKVKHAIASEAEVLA